MCTGGTHPSLRWWGQLHILRNSPSLARIATVVIGGVVAVEAVPMVLSAMGFTATGITSSSIAAKMMSTVAIANGGGVAPGSLVATLQSLGVTGLSGLTKFILGSTGSAIVAGIARFY
ncbi:interferon alpha-inducible protein 27, mitochondrial-like isoform X2 [Macaca thibetana thibetana]|uniref:interferon alpha-inducible protein 27, mitochondrial-like isoform X2 n=1 Tax=Macaca thibetana thibetana TaxID=257877 RepID=UPI0021BC79DE|nr:interferon alpha-inducible protein 27, mitochondrial-like isoform X2 [Macaca thibetana thibetana]